MASPGSIFLTGLMGAGKTTCGQRLARALGWPFVDLDQAVEARTGMTPRAIFEAEGEGGFRAHEAETLRQVLQRQRRGQAVIALGGGTWHQEGTPAQLRRRGATVFLDAPLPQLQARLVGPEREARPLLATPGALASLGARRRPGYLRADRVVDASGDPAVVAARVLDALGERSGASVASLRVALGERSYPIWIGGGGVEQAVSMTELWLESQSLLGRKVFVVTDERVAGHYLEPYTEGLRQRGLAVTSLAVPEGEGSKSLAQAEVLWTAMLEAGMGRGDLVVALGGGVVGDLAGFVASTLMRGVRLVQVPTTVLAQVDSSVGGKTAINHRLGKNLVGSFYQPSAVLMALGMLRTLDARHVRSGLAEVLKYGVLKGGSFLRLLEQEAASLASQPWAHREVIARCCAIKARVVADDEREQGARALLNLGHTFGHAIEALGGMAEVTHGEAVGLGMILAARASVKLGLAQRDMEPRLRATLEAIGLPTQVEPWLARSGEMAQAMSHDKKKKGARLQLVLPVRPGDVRLHPVALDSLPGLLEALASEAQAT
jgi:3-dehydroquinate synthase